MTISDLPALNASLNFVSTVFISCGWYLIRRGHWRRHVACMITAVISSTLFLAGYLIYHRAGDRPVSLFCNADLARPARFRHPSARHLHTGSGVSAALGTPYAHRALDDADLALRFSHRRAGLFHGL
jgi:hypothetical protein